MILGNGNMISLVGIRNILYSKAIHWHFYLAKSYLFCHTLNILKHNNKQVFTISLNTFVKCSVISIHCDVSCWSEVTALSKCVKEQLEPCKDGDNWTTGMQNKQEAWESHYWVVHQTDINPSLWVHQENRKGRPLDPSKNNHKSHLKTENASIEVSLFSVIILVILLYLNLFVLPSNILIPALNVFNLHC